MKKLLAFSALVALTIAASAQAEPLAAGHEKAHLNVPYGDLDLNREAGAKTMMFRIRAAATEVCGGLPSILEMRERKIFKGCFRQAVGEAVQQLGAPLVTAAFERELATGRFS